MTDLILDAEVVAQLCRENMPELRDVLRLRRDAGHRNWLYVGQLTQILDLLTEAASADGESDPQCVARTTLKMFCEDCQWLSALAGDAELVCYTDPMAAALVQAAKRLGDDALILTGVDSRLQCGTPFVDATSAEISALDSKVEFIDLKTQQDHIRSAVETNMHRVLHHGRYVMGAEISQLEQRLAQSVGVDHCICVSSGTDALLIALIAMGVGPGDEVITSPFSFFASVEVIVLLGAKPIYVDIDPATFNIDADKIEAAVTKRTRVILPVSLYGQCSDMDTINAIALRYNLTVIEDAAQSFGATYKGRHSGGLSDVACTSFFPAKPLGAYGDGGACFTADASLATVLRQVRDHGQDRRYHHARLGVNGRLDTLQAAVLLAKLDIFEDEIKNRQKVADRYAEKLFNLHRDGLLVLPFLHPHNTSSWAQYTLRVGVRDALLAAMTEQGIPTAVHYPVPLYEQPALLQNDVDCPESGRAANEVISLPMHPYLKPETQDRIIGTLANALVVTGSGDRLYYDAESLKHEDRNN